LRKTCIYETGIAFGKGKKVFVVRKRSHRPLPFGLDDFQVYYYKNKKHLGEVISEICKPYRRWVINFRIEIQNGNSQKALGIPQWYFEEKEIGLSLKMVILFIFMGLLLGITSALIFNSTLAGVGIGLAILGILVTISKKAQNFLESKIINIFKGR
jgi:hypothetical protein